MHIVAALRAKYWQNLAKSASTRNTAAGVSLSSVPTSSAILLFNLKVLPVCGAPVCF